MGVEEPEHEAAHLRLEMHGAMPPLPHTSSLNAQGQFYISQ